MDFALIPADAIQPLFYAEVDPSKAGGASVGSRPTLIFGSTVASATATANVAVQITSGAQAHLLGGYGSQFGRVCSAYLANDPYAEVYGIPVADGSTPGTSTLTFVGTTTATGTLHLEVGGQYLPIPVPTGTSATALGALVEAYLGVNEAAAIAGATLGHPSLYPCIAANTIGAVLFTSRNGGPQANTIMLRVNPLGAAAGQTLPAGMVITELASAAHVFLINGATAPVLTTAITGIINRRFSYVVSPWADAITLDALQTEFADTGAGRWGPIRKLYGNVFTADNAVYSVLSGAGLATAKNQDAHCSAFGIEACPTPSDELAAMYAGACAASLRNDRARPLNTLQLIGASAPAEGDRFIYSERDVLLKKGITTPMYSQDGKVLIQRAVSCKTLNAFGSADLAFRDITTAETLDQCLTEMEALITNKYGRVKLVGDEDQIAPGSAVATPSMVKADLVALYRTWARRAWVKDVDTFANLLVVEIDATDSTRLNVLWQPAIAGGLHIFAVLASFRLQYSASEVAGA
jgi:phage tail sheath gpL-like